MISKILRNTLAQIVQYEREYPDDAQAIAPGLFSLKFHIHSVLQYIERPTREDLEEQSEPPEVAEYWTGWPRRIDKRH